MKNTILKYSLLATLILPTGLYARRPKTPSEPRQVAEVRSDSEKTECGRGAFYNAANCCKGGGCINIQLSKKGDSQWSLLTGGLGFGLDGAINQGDGTGLQMGKSFEVNWLKAVAAEYRWKRNNAITFGLGFDWQNFKMTGEPYRMYKKSGGGLGLDYYPEGTHALNSTVKIFSLQIPVLYSIDVPCIYTKFSVGPIIHFNTYSSLKTSYNNDKGNKTTEFVKNIGQRPVTFDLFGSATWGGFGLYLKYSPLKELRSRSNINFNPLTVGIIFFM